MVDFLSSGPGAYPISAGAASFDLLSDLWEILAGGAYLFGAALLAFGALALPMAVIAVFSLFEKPHVTPWWAYVLMALVLLFVVCVEISAFAYFDAQGVF